MDEVSDRARRIIDELELFPHPEGGWYRETWRAAAAEGERAGGTLIWFLLEAGQRSHWHRVDGDEIWLWHAGHALTLLLADDDSGPVRELTLGPDVLGGARPQTLAPGGCWQATEARSGWGLVSCVVVPGFEFAGFELAAPGWAPGIR